MLKIGITFRIVEEINYVESRDALSHDWPKFLEKISALPLWIPNSLSNLESFLKELEFDGIILSGGDSIGETPERDKTEKSLIDFAIKNNIPIFGVCRGMQKINQYFGGTYETLSTSEHIGKEHLVDIKQEKFSTLLQLKTIKVNSFHHNIITKDTIGQNLIPFAFSKNDGTVEGFYHSKFPIIGVMWHPEREQKKFDELIIQQFFEKFNTEKK